MKESKSKGMNWAGNIFHKFEGIIPDVNDIMVQDPFKYVENHVHSVGGNLKKFCSGVVQDFLPLSVDPVKCEAKAVVPEGDAAISPFTHNNDSAISFLEISSDAIVKKSPVVIDGIDHEEKQLGHVSGHHNPDQPKSVKSSDTHENSESVLETSKINVLTNGDSGLCDDQNTIRESADGPVELTLPCVTESFEASSHDELIESSQDNEFVVSEIDPIDHAEKQLDHVSAGHHNASQFKTAEATNICETSDSVLLPVLTNAKSDLTDNVNVVKESADGPRELTFLGLTESLEASTFNESVETDHENDAVVLPDHVEKQQVASATSVQNLKIECSTGALCNSLADDVECCFGASSIPSETAVSVVSGEDTITGTGLVSSTSSRLRDSVSLPGYSSDILFPGAMVCRNPGDFAGCVSDSSRGLLSSTPDSIMSIKDKALEKQLVSSGSLRSLESTDGSSADIADSGMETIDLCDEMKLGESCIFVDDSNLYAVSRRARKLESYKKKIQDIFASKKRLAKEYEQLAIWYGDTDIDFCQDTSFDLQNLQTRHACDSEWELL